MQLTFVGTKAEILERLAPKLTTAQVLPQVRTSLGEWKCKPDQFFQKLDATTWANLPLIVRSSAINEDGAGHSMAGHYISIANVPRNDGLLEAIHRVVGSFDADPRHQFFVQPMLEDTVLSGVIFSRDPNTNAPYVVINYDDQSGSTTSVTAGSTNDVKTLYCYKFRPEVCPIDLRPLLDMVHELEELLQFDALDIEFAITAVGKLYLFQVRPLVACKGAAKCEDHESMLGHLARKIKTSVQPHPYLFGARTIFGVMPDWNPAEIIGIRPRPLSLSLYKDLVTDSIWAYQRHNYGYRNLRSFPLLVDFHGLPYVDVRVSFNSFVPADVPCELANALVNHYIDVLWSNPSQHDKVEFEIVFSCYTLDIPQRLQRLRAHGFGDHDCDTLANSLRRLTNRIIHKDSGLWLNDIARIQELTSRFETIRNSSLDTVSKIYWMLEDCKRYGTLPFAGLARAAFIAVQFLRSMVSVNILDSSEFSAFLSTLDTVSSQMGHDYRDLSSTAFLEKYGHLRPGTYDITSPRYDEAPEYYFDGATGPGASTSRPEFTLSLKKLNALEKQLADHGLQHNVLSLFHFLKSAIEGREYSKFVFTRSLSEVLRLIRKLGAEYGITPDECSYLNVSCIKTLYSTGQSPETVLRESIADGHRRFALAQQIVLPPLIVEPEDVYCFHLPASDPNYITLGRVLGPVTHLDLERARLPGSILFIPSADPGYDWIFAHRIGGLVTMFGGTNSHMAIRAAELGIPSVIGAGEKNYQRWSQAAFLEIDCANRSVRILGQPAAIPKRSAA